MERYRFKGGVNRFAVNIDQSSATIIMPFLSPSQELCLDRNLKIACLCAGAQINILIYLHKFVGRATFASDKGTRLHGKETFCIMQ